MLILIRLDKEDPQLIEPT